MTDTVLVEKIEGENTTAMYRRFAKQFRSTGIQTAVKREKFHDRKPSKNVRKKECINRLKKRRAFELSYRLGKISTLQKK